MMQWIYTCLAKNVKWKPYSISGKTAENGTSAEEVNHYASLSGRCRIQIKTDEKKQEILGFGGAFTDTSAMALQSMPAQVQDEVIRACFDPVNGLAYNMGRIPIGSADFSTIEYDTDGKNAAEKADISQDKKGIIPMIQRCCSQSREQILLYALPWSPPARMKTNGTMRNGGKLKKECYADMAKYLVDFIEAYEKEGIRLWGIAPQNEPVETQKWPSCIYSGEEERTFLKNYLIPELDQRGYSDKKILFWDCNKDLLLERTREMMEDQAVQNRVFGAAFHWYSGEYYDQLDQVHKEYPKLKLLATEACVVMPGNLSTVEIGESYAHGMIGDLNHWSSMWMDWNLFLNENSGPAIVYNPCAAPIILDSRTGSAWYMSSYFYIGHFSRYIRRGAHALNSHINAENPGLEACAFMNSDGSIVCVLLNKTDQKTQVSLTVDDDQDIVLWMDPHSIGTYICQQNK